MNLIPGLRPLLSMLSPPGAGARLSILIYHRVLPEADPLLPGEVDAATFRWHLDLVKRLFTPLPLSEAIERISEDRLPARALCITFDDGYEDNASVALPLLEEAGVPATFFIATGYLDGGMMFNDRIIETVRRLPKRLHDFDEFGLGRHDLNDAASRVAAYTALIRHAKYLPPDEREAMSLRVAQRIDEDLPADLMMQREQVLQLRRAGMDIGGHTTTHPILSQLDDRSALADMRHGRNQLQEILDEPVTLFAYPNGKPGKDFDERHVKMAREIGYQAAVTTAAGVSTRNTDLFDLHRFTPWDQTPSRFALRLARNLMKA